MVTLHTPFYRSCWVCLYLIYLLKPFLDFELYNTEEPKGNQQEENEVYYEEPDLLGGIEGVDYIIQYGLNSKDTDE
jgi:hypothetical protein